MNIENDIKIKIASSKEDILSIEKIAGEIWREHYTPIIGELQVNYMLEKYQSFQQIDIDIKTNDFVYLMAYLNHQLSGYAAIKIIEGKLFLSKFYIHKNFRGKKIASSLLDTIKNFAIANRLTSLWLTVNKHNYSSIAVYKHFGFNIVESLVTDIGNEFVMDDYRMSLSI